MGDSVRVRDFEATFLQVFAVIEHRAANKESALGIDNEADIRSRHENVALFGTVYQIHHVLQAGATAADHGET